MMTQKQTYIKLLRSSKWITPRKRSTARGEDLHLPHCKDTVQSNTLFYSHLDCLTTFAMTERIILFPPPSLVGRGRG